MQSCSESAHHPSCRGVSCRVLYRNHATFRRSQSCRGLSDKPAVRPPQADIQACILQHQTASEPSRDVSDPNLSKERSNVGPDLSRRGMLLSAVTGITAQSTTYVLPIFSPEPAEALPITTKLLPIGQAPPGTYNLGVAAVRDPALYRCSSNCTHVNVVLTRQGQNDQKRCEHLKGHGNRAGSQK